MTQQELCYLAMRDKLQVKVQLLNRNLGDWEYHIGLIGSMSVHESFPSGDQLEIVKDNYESVFVSLRGVHCVTVIA